MHAENGAENQPQQVAIDAPQVGEQVDGHRQSIDVMQPVKQSAVFDDLQAENPPVMDHWMRRSTRVTRPPDRYEPSLDYVLLTDCGEPSCYKEAMQRDDSKKWFKAMVSEMQSLEKNHTWDLVDLPKRHKALPCKWVYKKKVTSDASSKYKARLVAKGYKQKHGVDFDEIFSSVVKLATLRLALGLVASQDVELKQMDVKIAFLHGDLLEMIHMMQPDGFVSKGQEKKERFDMKDLGNANHILGMRDRPNRRLYLSQRDYIDKVLHRFHMEEGKAIGTPLPPYVKQTAQDCPKTDDMRAEMAKIPYALAVGSLMYAMVATRPDIAFGVGVVSRYMSNPGKKHWEAVKCILRYLKGTKDLCICFGKSETFVHGFTDADFAKHPDCRKSTSRYVFTFTRGAVSWISRLQKCVALSTTEAEYVAATEATKEALWLMRLVGELGIDAKIPVLHCDSQSAIIVTSM
ncbi:hypothetical protein L7F22_011686 [Adiantum nelumboides]|nr:hypothetical protein [Adiantum nelumboides]